MNNKKINLLFYNFIHFYVFQGWFLGMVFSAIGAVICFYLAYEIMKHGL
ncbi:hypothetical protein [Anaerosinus sp.]